MKKLSLLSLSILTQAVFAQTVFPLGQAFAQQSPGDPSINSPTPPATPKSSQEIINEAKSSIKQLEEISAQLKNGLVKRETELKGQLLNATDPGEKAKVEKEMTDFNENQPKLIELSDKLNATAQQSKELVAKVESGEADSQTLTKEMSDLAERNFKGSIVENIGELVTDTAETIFGLAKTLVPTMGPLMDRDIDTQGQPAQAKPEGAPQERAVVESPEEVPQVPAEPQ